MAQNILQDLVLELDAAWRVSQRWDSLTQRVSDSHDLLAQLGIIVIPGGGQGGADSTQLLNMSAQFEAHDNCLLVPALLLRLQERVLDALPLPVQMQFTRQVLALLGSMGRAPSHGSGGALACEEELLQVHYCAKDLAAITARAVTIDCTIGEPQRSIRPILNAVQFLGQPQCHPNTLTPFHSYFLQGLF